MDYFTVKTNANTIDVTKLGQTTHHHRLSFQTGYVFPLMFGFLRANHLFSPLSWYIFHKVLNLGHDQTHV